MLGPPAYRTPTRISERRYEKFGSLCNEIYMSDGNSTVSPVVEPAGTIPTAPKEQDVAKSMYVEIQLLLMKVRSVSELIHV